MELRAKGGKYDLNKYYLDRIKRIEKENAKLWCELENLYVGLGVQPDFKYFKETILEELDQN